MNSWKLASYLISYPETVKKGMLDLKSFDRADEGILHTLPTAEILSGKNAGAWVSMDFI